MVEAANSELEVKTFGEHSDYLTELAQLRSRNAKLEERSPSLERK